MFGNVRSQLSAEPNGGRAEIRLQRAEYLLFGLGLASAACAVVLLTAIVAMGQRHPSVYKSGIINAFNPPAFAAAACALFTGMKLCRSCEQHEAVNNKKKLLRKMQAINSGCESVYNNKSRAAAANSAFVVLAGRVSESRFCENGLFNSLFTKHETLTQPTAEGTVIFVL